MQTPSVDQLVGQVLGNYHLERFLGKGRLNAVYLARHLESQRTDALALYLIPERFSIDARNLFLARFRKEAAAITTLDHPHILPVYAHGEYGGYPYLVTPYMMQGSLADTLKTKGRCDHVFVLPILEQLVDGMTYAHNRGFIHGTLKPANVLLHADNTMQVAGFGLMHMLQQRGIEPGTQPYTHLLSIADTFLASPEYIAPEVVQGQAVDIRSDIYSLGCILFELLSGQPPFRGEKPLDIAKQHVTQALPSLRKLAPDMPVVLSSVVHQALERDPAQRFQSVAELGEAFAQASRGATSYQTQRTVTTDEVNRVRKPQETPRENYATDSWQRRTPVTTGQISAMKGPSGSPPRVAASTTDNWQLLPPIVTGRMPAFKAPVQAGGTKPVASVSAPPTLPPIAPQEMVAPVQKAPTRPVAPPPATPQPKAKPEKSQANSGNSMPGTNADTSELVKAYEWWSQSDQVQAAAEPAPRPAPSDERARQLPLANEADWTAEPLPSEFTTRGRKQRSAQGPRKMQRRKVFAFIAAGGVAVAGTALFLNFGHIAGTANTQTPRPTAQKPAANDNNKAAAQPQANAAAPANNGQMTMQKTSATKVPAANNGTAVGSTKQASNTAVDFMNPADKKDSFLINLAGNFVAYERACTHEGVTVNYDPGTKMIVCPAHGAIFDPAKNASVVQGPADQPLPKVRIKVNGDGTITAV